MLLQLFRQDMVWCGLGRSWLDSGCILKMESTECADGLEMETEQGRERGGVWGAYEDDMLAGLVASN